MSDSLRNGRFNFTYLPDFARYLLENKLKDLTVYQLALSRKLELPIMKYFTHWPEEQLINASADNSRLLYTAIAEGRLAEYISDSIEQWRSGKIPFISSDQIISEDITGGNYVQKRTLAHFAEGYTDDRELIFALLAEIDEYLLESETASLKVLTSMQHALYNESQAISKTGNLVCELQPEKLIVSDEVYRIYQLAPDTINALPDLLKYIDERDAERVRSHFTKAIETGNDFTTEFKIITAKGNRKTIRLFIQVKTSPADLRKTLFGSVQDISTEHSLRQELQWERAFAEMLIENSPDLIAGFNKDLQTIVWNKKSEEVTGLKKDQVLGKSPEEIFNDPEAAGWIGELKRALKGENFYHAQEKIAGTEFYAENYVIPVKDEKDILLGALSVTRDITTIVESSKEITRINEDLRRNADHYQKMIMEVKDYAIILLNRDGIIQNWNEGAEKIKGYTKEDILGKNFRIFYTDADRLNKIPEKLINEAVSSGSARNEGWRVRKDGSTFWGTIVITALHNDEGDVIGFSKVTRDLTERKMAEITMAEYTELLQKKNHELRQINKGLDSFNYIASHDLQEPLRKIMTFSTRVLETELENLSEKGREYFDRIVNAAGRMRHLIDDLLEFSRATITAESFSWVDGNTIIEEIISELRPEIDLAEAVIEVVELPPLHGVAFQLRQVFENIVSNSLKYASADRKLTVAVSYKRVKGSEIKNEAAFPEHYYHRIRFSDNGIGFAQEYATRIFDLFQRLHGKNEYSGSGIGLAICKKSSSTIADLSMLLECQAKELSLRFICQRRE